MKIMCCEPTNEWKKLPLRLGTLILCRALSCQASDLNIIIDFFNSSQVILHGYHVQKNMLVQSNFCRAIRNATS